MEKYQQKYEEWCNNPIFDEETKKALLKMKDDEAEKKDSFYNAQQFCRNSISILFDLSAAFSVSYCFAN